jgi:hypothetical protein
MARTKMLIALGLAVGLVPLASEAMGPYDGVYAGTQRITKTNNSTQCSKINQDNLKILVQDSTIRYRWGEVGLEAKVAGDGSFSVDVAGGQSRGYSSTVSLKGKITTGSLEADVGGNICAGHMSLRKTF